MQCNIPTLGSAPIHSHLHSLPWHTQRLVDTQEYQAGGACEGLQWLLPRIQI